MSLSSVQRCGCGISEYGDVLDFLHIVVVAFLSKSQRLENAQSATKAQWSNLNG